MSCHDAVWRYTQGMTAQSQNHLLKDLRELLSDLKERDGLYLELPHPIKMIWHYRSWAVLCFDALESWGWCKREPSTLGQLVQMLSCNSQVTDFATWLPWVLKCRRGGKITQKWELHALFWQHAPSPPPLLFVRWCTVSCLAYSEDLLCPSFYFLVSMTSREGWGISSVRPLRSHFSS